MASFGVLILSAILALDEDLGPSRTDVLCGRGLSDVTVEPSPDVIPPGAGEYTVDGTRLQAHGLGLKSSPRPLIMSRESPMNWRDRVVAHPDVLVGKPVIKGTRISVELVMDLLAAGYTAQQIIEQYDHLTREDIQACLAYAREVVQSERVYAVRR